MSSADASLNSFLVESYTYLSLGLLIILLRTFTRVRQVGFVGLALDDYAMLGIIIPYISESIMAQAVGQQFHGVSNSGMTDAQRAALSPESDEYGWRSAHTLTCSPLSVCLP
jgi:hypothetical protein